MHLFTVKFDAAATDADQLLDNVDENVVMKALDGFLLILSNDGDVIYVSENIQEYIGIQQVCITYYVIEWIFDLSIFLE